MFVIISVTHAAVKSRNIPLQILVLLPLKHNVKFHLRLWNSDLQFLMLPDCTDFEHLETSDFACHLRVCLFLVLWFPIWHIYPIPWERVKLRAITTHIPSEYVELSRIWEGCCTAAPHQGFLIQTQSLFVLTDRLLSLTFRFWSRI